ncbi:hypothetical protein H4Q26_013061 [Puccinia striiformis f. sp. tritici PST-130]|nr:hypothetical protein H4Q26_013061 [Puccinia striiformis f. sp. tritici PST-130]
MFAGSSPLLAVVLSSLSLAHAAAANDAPAPPASGAPAPPPLAVPFLNVLPIACRFGAGEVSSYCKHPEFLLAYNNCLHDNCKGDDLTAGKQAGDATTAPVTVRPSQRTRCQLNHRTNTPGTNPANSTVTPTAVGLTVPCRRP